MAAVKDLSGMRFGRLVAVEYVGSKKNKARWLCRCDCGNEKVISATHLQSGDTRSCGCLKSEMMAQKQYKHGMRRTRLYNIWTDMKMRCKNPTAAQYRDYGGRGIAVCSDWANSFAVFRDWSLQNGYSEDLSIDRINNDGNYEPSNCKWSTRKEQNNNKRNSRNRRAK